MLSVKRFHWNNGVGAKAFRASTGVESAPYRQTIGRRTNNHPGCGPRVRWHRSQRDLYASADYRYSLAQITYRGAPFDERFQMENDQRQMTNVKFFSLPFKDSFPLAKGSL